METIAGIGRVKQVDIDQEMQQAYLDYAMSVIVARALPDVCDGLKPVQRRILYAMHDMGLDHDKPYKKSARIVGEVLGKYHPHGDSAVYDAMVRMAQDFSMRYPLVDGQGNFGSIDGDNAAAMRYTEARLAQMAAEMLTDIEKDTVDFVPNFDGSLQEPAVLPARLPNLLVNGSSGIAVGMATNIPPHNLGEVCDAIVYLIDHYKKIDDITIDDLMRFIKGPDFPTGGIVYRYGHDRSARQNGDSEENDMIATAYAQGRGRFVVQAKAHIEEMSRNRHRIVVTELPYQTNKTNLIERIAELAREGRIEGITDLRDESDRQGMRIVIELTRNAAPREVLAELFRLTPMQQTFGVSMLALVDGEPRLLSLKRMLQLYIEHRQRIIRRRSEYDLQRARERAHILEGLLIALDHLDEVIATIRRSPDAETARDRLMRKFKLTEIQAQAILDMQLRRLARLERERIKQEHKEKLELIAYLEDLLAHPDKILALIRDEVRDLKQRYGDARRTQIVDRTQGALTARDLIEDQAVWVSVSQAGGLSRSEATNATRTAIRQNAAAADVALLAANTRDELLLFTADGRMARIGIHRIPAQGEAHWADLCDLSRRDRVVAALAIPRVDDMGEGIYLTLVTRAGKIKRSSLKDVLNTTGIVPVMNVDADDELRFARIIGEDTEIGLITAQGQGIRFKISDVRPTGLLAGGVGAIKLKDGDAVVAAEIVDEKAALLTVTQQGYAKRTVWSEFPTQGRYGAGVIAHKISAKTGPVVGAVTVGRGAAPLAVITDKGTVKALTGRDAPEAGRNTQGKAVISLARGDAIALVVPLTAIEDAVSEASGPNGSEPTTSPGKAPRRTRTRKTTVETAATKATIRKRATKAADTGDEPAQKPIRRRAAKAEAAAEEPATKATTRERAAKAADTGDEPAQKPTRRRAAKAEAATKEPTTRKRTTADASEEPTKEEAAPKARSTRSKAGKASRSRKIVTSVPKKKP
ncbi:MAG: DNA gyrase subunit A [Anaerolineae bacterium]